MKCWNKAERKNYRSKNSERKKKFRKPKLGTPKSSSCISFVASHLTKESQEANDPVIMRWIIESGATTHMYNDRMVFESLQRKDNLSLISLCNGHKAPICGMGNVTGVITE